MNDRTAMGIGHSHTHTHTHTHGLSMGILGRGRCARESFSGCRVGPVSNQAG